MSELATLARPYATAAFKRAQETGTAKEWGDSLKFLAAVVQDPQIQQAASNPKADKSKFTRDLLDLCSGQLADEAQNFVRLLVTNRRLNLIGLISEQYDQFRADQEGYVDAEVLTAYPLDDEEINQITQVLQQTFGKQPHLNIKVDQDLIGGVVIRAGDRVIDASIRGQIQRLAKRLYN